MTRTERSNSLRAMLKDRSESRSGLDKSVRKNGAGAHSWGSVRDELEHEREALDDEGIEEDELEDVPVGVNAAVRPPVDVPGGDETSETSATEPSTSGTASNDSIEDARQFRAKGLQGNIDLSAIARTSAGANYSPPKGPQVEITRDADTRILA